MKQKVLAGIIAMGLFGAMQAASAQSSGVIRSLPKNGSWSVTPEFGTELGDNGLFTNSTSQSVGASGTVAGKTLSVAVTVSSQGRDFKDVYKDAYSAGASFNYGLSESTEVFGRLKYTEAKANEFDAANVNVAVTWGTVAVGANATVQGKLSNYNSWGFEIGGRHFFSTKDAFKPYIAPSIGFTKVDDIDLEYLKFGGTNITTRASKMYKSTLAFNLGIGIGFRYDLSKTTAIGVETGYRYQDKLKANDDDLGSYGVNRSGKRSFMPLSVGVNIAF